MTCHFISTHFNPKQRQSFVVPPLLAYPRIHGQNRGYLKLIQGPSPVDLPIQYAAALAALRHWVILCKLSSGIRTPVGSRLIALLARIIDTCRQRGHAPCSSAPAGGMNDYCNSTRFCFWL
ncbi:MAG: hypothetical protein LAE24_00545 [Candidatus Contendobacter sp.]|nr:hypothetical protein [Candidatus Contendobacter sp.]